MAIPIRFFTAVLKKSAIEAGYPGGLARFLQDHPGVPQDEQLVGVPFMSGDGLQSFTDVLKAISFDLSGGFAVGETYHGEWEPCNGIEFKSIHSDDPFPAWEAVATCQEVRESPAKKPQWTLPILIISLNKTYKHGPSLPSDISINNQFGPSEKKHTLAPKSAEERSAALNKAVEKHQSKMARTRNLATYPYLVVRIMSAVYQYEHIKVSAGARPIAQIGNKCSLVLRPEPFNAEGALSTACRAFLLSSVQHAVRETGHKICIVWGPTGCTYVEANSTLDSVDPPSGGIKAS